MKYKVEEKQRRKEVLNYLESVFRKERPCSSVHVFRAKTQGISTDELYRIADAIQRFGLNDLFLR
jgi:hypothetical protein